MLRWCLAGMLFCLTLGQTLANVTVWVDMQQTGPTDTTGAVIPRVGSNVNATYTASAGYNGQPPLNTEEMVTGTVWTYSVSAGTGVAYSPQSSSTGSSANITASHSVPGTYAVGVTFTVVFTITKYKSNGTVDSVRTDGPYNGSGSATLTVKNGKFEVKIKPADLIPQYSGDTNGYRNKVGIGETITICVFPEAGSSDTVVFDYTMFNAASFPQTVGVGDFPRTISLDVYAKVNGTSEGPESIGVTVIEPTGAGLVKKIGSGVWHVKNTASVGFWGMGYIIPDDVSFSAVDVREETCPGETTGYFIPFNQSHPPGTWLDCNHNIHPDSGKRNTWMQDDIGGQGLTTPFSEGTFIWSIPWEFKCGTNQKQIAIMTHTLTINASGDMTISKGGITQSAMYADPSSNR